jgi:hypothetical protein
VCEPRVRRVNPHWKVPTTGRKCKIAERCALGSHQQEGIAEHDEMIGEFSDVSTSFVLTTFTFIHEHTVHDNIAETRFLLDSFIVSYLVQMENRDLTALAK